MTGGVLLVELGVRLLLPFYTPEVARRHAITYEQRVYAGYLMTGHGRLVDLDRAKAWGLKGVPRPSERQIFISENGYRGPGFEVRKPRGTYRIVVIGGSAVFDQNVSDASGSIRSSWPHRIEAHLAEAGFDHVEVINAGIPGQTSADSLARLYTQLWTYAPDMVAVYHGWNDFKFYHRIGVSPETPLIDRVLPYDPRTNPFLYYRGGLDRLLATSQVYVQLRTRYFAWRWQPSYEGAVPQGIETAGSYGPYGPRQHRLNLTLISEAARAIGAEPVIIKQATLAAPGNSTAELERIGYEFISLTHAAIVSAFGESYASIDRIGVASDVLVVDPTRDMNGHGEYFSDHVHLTPAGSRQLALLVSRRLLSAAAPFVPDDGAVVDGN